jgi:hypothetical protein
MLEGLGVTKLPARHRALPIQVRLLQRSIIAMIIGFCSFVAPLSSAKSR